MGMSSMSARIGGIMAPYVLDLQDVAGPLPLIIFGVFSGVAGGLALLLPEPLGKPLPQTLDDIAITRRCVQNDNAIIAFISILKAFQSVLRLICMH